MLLFPFLPTAWRHEWTLNRQFILPFFLGGRWRELKNEQFQSCIPATKWMVGSKTSSSVQCRDWEGSTIFWTSIKSYSWQCTVKQTHPPRALKMSDKLFIDLDKFKHVIMLLCISWTAVGDWLAAYSCWQSELKKLFFFFNLNKRDLYYL